ncbi:unnamed protein product [Ceutorhynchus assimilis]|uniref:Uncharacterized protein n=1 Tax=Ceutorhynchus assimilis TaxID=467358 RepID=A0A9N9M8Y5_9CUCU|nr:unnamed protein product [Ceutorhynchus assimilis]
MNLRAGGEFDRYIPRRSSSDLAHLNLTNNSSDDDLLNVEFDDEKNGYPHPIFANTAKRANNMISYKNRILGALGITSSSIFKPSNKREYITNNIEARSWPVKSRKMPLIKAPETLLDMPGAEGFDNVIIRHMIDWSSKGIIATIFREEVHLWSEGLGQLGQTNTNRTVANCVKWNKSGSKFAVARTSSKVSIIDGATLKASFYYENPREDSINGCNFLTVFSSLHNRVDEVRFHVGRVPYVIWDGTGTKLASVGTDENLALWNFFGADPETHKMLNREPKRHPRVFDFQYLFDTCLR